MAQHTTRLDRLEAKRAVATAMPEDIIKRFYDDALGFVMWTWDWEGDPNLQIVKLLEPWSLVDASKYGPDAWACQFLQDVGAEVRERNFDGKTAVAPIRMAAASGRGIGKSALVAWLTIWIMATRPYARGTITAATSPQLESRTWPTIATWLKRARPEVRDMFDITTARGAMRMRHKVHPESWFCTAQTCDPENSEAFAGQHAANSTSFYVFDESSGVPDQINEVSEGGLVGGEPMKFCFGNPTRNTGWFKDAFGKLRHRHDHLYQIDSREVQITNKKELAEKIEDYGEDSDYVKVQIRGMFPTLAARQFISVADADAALGRHLRPEQYEFAPVILTCDPAWEGDDELVIAKRQGLKFDILRVIAKNDNDLEIATLLATLEDEHQADAVAIDGGFGTGIISAGRSMGRDWQIVWFSGKSPDEGCLNLRAYMWKSVRDWLKAGGAIPPDQVLYRDLIGPELVGRPDGKLQLEAKKDTKARGLPSPNRGDALALSFAFPVTNKLYSPSTLKRRDHDPYGENMRCGHDPFKVLQR
jgi:hypothetical protein